MDEASSRHHYGWHLRAGLPQWLGGASCHRIKRVQPHTSIHPCFRTLVSFVCECTWRPVWQHLFEDCGATPKAKVRFSIDKNEYETQIHTLQMSKRSATRPRTGNSEDRPPSKRSG
ncbi:unnamed protein product [Ixodes pacificus]